MDYNYYKYSKHIYILIQAPYNTDIYKISMKMKPVWQIMYSVNVMVSLFFFFLPCGERIQRECSQLILIVRGEDGKYHG